MIQILVSHHSAEIGKARTHHMIPVSMILQIKTKNIVDAIAVIKENRDDGKNYTCREEHKQRK